MSKKHILIVMAAIMQVWQYAAMAQTQPMSPGSCEVASQVAFGGMNHLDTYLSPEKYKGVEPRFVSDVTRMSKKHPLTYRLTHEAAIAYVSNRSKTAHEFSGHYDFAYGVLRHWNIADDKVTLMAGGVVNAFVGFAYNTRNGANNPAQAYISANLGAQVVAQYRFALWGKQMRLTYEARVPMVGMMFSPNYGQSYYEIFNKGNYDHNIVVTSVTTFQIRQHLSLDIPIGLQTSLRVGYLNDIRQSEPNNLKQHQWYNAAVIGIVLRK
jgi:hypothetical protein